MTKPLDTSSTRRDLMKAIGGSMVLIPLAGIIGCSQDQAPAGAAPPPAPASPSPAARPEPAPAAAAPAQKPADLPKLAEDDPAAKALGYRHDTAMVDKAMYPRHEASQQCRGCALFLADASAEWAGCSIFPGKAVNANGWCNAFAPKA